MIRMLVLLTFWVPAAVHSQNFTGQVYRLAESYLDDKCTVNPECDCCSSDLIFFTDSQFGMVARCIFNDIYYTGTYSVNAGTLILKFKQTVVSEIIDEETSKVNNKRQNSRINPMEFKIVKCGQNKIRLRLEGEKNLENGSRCGLIEEKKIITELKGKTAWKMVTS